MLSEANIALNFKRHELVYASGQIAKSLTALLAVLAKDGDQVGIVDYEHLYSDVMSGFRSYQNLINETERFCKISHSPVAPSLKRSFA